MGHQHKAVWSFPHVFELDEQNPEQCVIPKESLPVVYQFQTAIILSFLPMSISVLIGADGALKFMEIRCIGMEGALERVSHSRMLNQKRVCCYHHQVPGFKGRNGH